MLRYAAHFLHIWAGSHTRAGDELEVESEDMLSRRTGDEPEVESEGEYGWRGRRRLMYASVSQTL